MTDGISHDSVVRPSRDLRNAGVRILALGIGRKFRRSQLYQMAGNSRYVFKAGFRSLSGVVRSIKRAACGGNWFLTGKIRLLSYLNYQDDFSQFARSISGNNKYLWNFQTKLENSWKDCIRDGRETSAIRFTQWEMSFLQWLCFRKYVII